jgi:hypothetical protein
MADADAAVFEPVFYEHPIHYLLPLSAPGTGASTKPSSVQRLAWPLLPKPLALEHPRPAVLPPPV